MQKLGGGKNIKININYLVIKMKVQWQLIDIETKKSIPVDEVFEAIDAMKYLFDGQISMSMRAAFFLFGDPTIPKPHLGVIKGAIDEKHQGM